MILVTGGAGYIGSHCAMALLEDGQDIVVFDSLELGHQETIDTLENANAKGKVIDFIRGNLQNFDDINNVFKKHKIDAVVHFAAFSQVGESVKNPQKYYFNNVYGSLNLFRAMLENDVKQIVFSSTAATYGEPVYTPIDENHPQNPINPYGSSKLMIEKILDDYNKAYGLRSVRLRYFNVAGADSQSRIGEWHEPETHLIPNVLKSTFSSGKTFEMYGTDYNTVDGTCVRDYINIENLVNAHLLALKYLENGGETNFFNLGTKNGNSVKEVFSVCEEITEQKIPVNVMGRREGDPATLVADNKKAIEMLNWNPDKSLEDSVKSAYNWEKILQERLSK
ncbi:MAG: UDP-glucose 4-epimerase GalE [Candidatus Gastranaerophilales bacterium]|nr:UDP-glucose 4-epimerase GalE [Candidatus Gastranaerophilales bacterium]